ncbi:hypothetical protein GUITHDRAFT_74667 [Guillardia theta CCMP2712]|uniref:Uncharacterized protein n=1 Tax=Guillardia theta (strain CCMP2712) TaxID=905079 RepID=L1IYW4_GUITC|nr:hypothetical protein GUITHDRAFT_74667 [Guillardia theta CCMP2712]EKX41463.1 hypothetical protein GUITHDRAFT_74667 [Guillardia theta CCMP2712]|eukprot:XP_005828443.1 hypothetical protein GUITHDRAFT_74667 [Guillardia theta CCMP2712]
MRHHRFEESDKPAQMQYSRIIHKVLPFLWPENLQLRFRVVICVLLIISARVANVMVPQLYKGIIDSLTGSKTADPLFPLGYIIIYTGLKLFQTLQRDARGFVWLDVEQDTNKRIKLAIFSHLHSLSHSYHISRKTGEVLKVTERGASSLQSLLNMALFTIGPTIFDLILICTVLMIDTDVACSLVILVSMVVYFYITIYMNDWRKQFRRAMIDADNQCSDRAVNSLMNFETVKFFGMERKECEYFEENLVDYNRAAWKNEASLYALNAAQQTTLAAGAFLCMYISGKKVVDGSLTVGDFVMIQTYIVQLSQPLAWLGTAWRVLQQAFIDMEKMFELLDVKARDYDYGKSEVLPSLLPSLPLPHLPQVLSDLSFEIPAGHTAAFVGKTGAGKSTIARLLMRFYELDTKEQGAVCVDGMDIRKVKQQSLREAIGIVPQDAVLFNDTIRYNLAYGRQDATLEEIMEAARIAAVHDTIMNFPDKYETRVGERGLKLSGGEKQVAIARTILKNPKIVLLDEATSALDSHTEYEIQGALEEMCKGRTTLIIAHRLSTVTHAHVIFVLEGGAIIEKGAHSELLLKDGVYASMWKRQLEKREITVVGKEEEEGAAD